jgi:hypothetical protein
MLPICLLIALGSGSAFPQAPIEARMARLEEAYAKRPLTCAEATELVAQATVLLDKDAALGKRWVAAYEFLDRLRHRAAGPALRRLMHDEADDPTLRTNATRALLAIGETEALLDAVELLDSANQDVRGNVHEMLLLQYPEGREFGYHAWDPVDQRQAAIRRWREWYEAAKGTLKVNAMEFAL